MSKLLVVCTVALVGALLIACGDDDSDGSSSTPAEPTATVTEAATEAPAGAAGDSEGGAGSAQSMSVFDFGYDPAGLTVTSGDEVMLEVTNTGGLPHTFTIDGVVDSGVVEAGESASVSFTPDETGTLTFYCTIHGESRMSGELTVE